MVHFAAAVYSRTSLYNEYCESLSSRYGKIFDPLNLDSSLNAIKGVDEIGNQIEFTFWSMVSTIYYEDLFSMTRCNSFIEQYYGDRAQNLYVAYASSLQQPLSQVSFQDENSSRLRPFSSSTYFDLFRTMRQKAWEAAIRYVAISLTDRDLNLLRRIDRNAIKLTVHGKKGELHFLSATRQDANMTAQHSTGGLSQLQSDVKITFRYRLERETADEYPVLLEPLPDTPSDEELYGPLKHIQKIDQPICYVADPRLIGDGMLHSFLSRKG